MNSPQMDMLPSEKIDARVVDATISGALCLMLNAQS